MRIRSVSYAAIAIAGGFGFAGGPAFAQPAPTPPPAAEAPVVVPATPAAPAAEPAAPTPALELAPVVPAEAGAGRSVVLGLDGSGPLEEIVAILTAQFETMDANDDGRLTPEEFAAGWEGVFLLLDQNADGVLDAADRAIAAGNMAALAAETRDERAAGEGRGDGAGAGGDRTGGNDGRGADDDEYRRGGSADWGHDERNRGGGGGGSFFFRFPGGFLHFYMTPGVHGGHGMSGPPGMGMGMPFFFQGPGFPGMPGGNAMPGWQTMPGGNGMPGRGWTIFPPGAEITIQPGPGGGDRTGGGTGGWVGPNEDRGGGGTGGWVTPGANGAPVQVMPAVPNTRETKPTDKP